MTDRGPRDLTKTLPGTGPLKLVDGDAVATVLRDLAIGVDELGKGLHAKLDTLALAPRPVNGPSGGQRDPASAAAPPSQPPPASKRQVATAATVGVVKWGTLAIGILGIAAQVAKIWRPSLVAPLDQIIAIGKQLTGVP